jgi:hypothetical protein
VTVEADGDWSGLADSHALAMEFSGPTLEATLTRAVEGFADALGDVHPSMVAQRHQFEARASTPSALLLAVLEECLRCRREGRFAVGLSDPVIVDDVLTAGVDTVPVDDPHLQSSLPPVISWHEVRLDVNPGGDWSGRIIAR